MTVSPQMHLGHACSMDENRKVHVGQVVNCAAATTRMPGGMRLNRATARPLSRWCAAVKNRELQTTNLDSRTLAQQETIMGSAICATANNNP